MTYFENSNSLSISRKSTYIRFEAWFLFIILTLIWGSSFILIKKGLEAFPPVEAASLRIIFAFIVLIPLLPESLRNLKKGELKYIAASSLLGNLLPSLLFSFAQTKIASSVSGMLNALTPVFTIVIASAFFGYKVRFNQVAGLVIGLAGAIGLSFVSAGGSIGELNSYSWLIVAATICYAMNVNILKSKLAGVDSKSIAAVSMLINAPVCLVYIIIFSDFGSGLFSHAKAVMSTVSLAVLGIFATAVGLILYARLIKLSTPVFASSVAYLLPVVAVFWGLLDGESLYPLHYVAMLLIIAGVLIANKTTEH